MRKAMWLFVPVCAFALVLPRLPALAATAPAKKEAMTFRDVRMDQVTKFRKFVTSLQGQGLSETELQNKIKEYAKTELLTTFLDFKKTEEGAKAADEIDREVILIAIQLAEDDSFVDEVLKSRKDEKEVLELKLFAAEQYGRRGGSDKAKNLINGVLQESKGKYPDIYKQADVALFRSAPQGMVFPEFPEGTKDVNGKAIRIADYKGKTVLVDFWATWCGPCRPEVPNLVKAYQKYRSKGFEIIGISLDRSKKDFLEFTEKEKMTWRHYFDGLYWENKVARAYGVRAIPAMYLVGKDGKVISNNVRGGRLETILAKELGGENK